MLVCDAGPRRNAAATHVHNFVTRDGTPPDDFRRVAREQLAAYPEVSFADEVVEAITGSAGAFHVHLASGAVDARRIVLATGMIDEPLPIAGFRELWGRSIFQCPYCHGWEAQDRRWGYLALPTNTAHMVPFARMLRGWTAELTLFTHGAIEIAGESEAMVRAAGVRVETAPIVRLVGGGAGLEAVELAGGTVVPCDVLFTQPPQRQVPLVQSLGLALDGDGCVVADPMRRETSITGVYAVGDLTTRGQAAVLAAASGMQTAAAINVDLAMEG